jgi:hypothetical protein
MWHMPIILALGRQRQVSEFKVSPEDRKEKKKCLLNAVSNSRLGAENMLTWIALE